MEDNLNKALARYIFALGGRQTVVAGIVKVKMPDGSEWDFTEPTQLKGPDRLNEAEVQLRLISRLKKPFTFERMMRSGDLLYYRIRDANDDWIACSHEECYANYIIDALNRPFEPTVPAPADERVVNKILELWDLMKEMDDDELKVLAKKIEEKGTDHEDGVAVDWYVVDLLEQGITEFEE